MAGVPLDQFCEMRGHYNHETAMKEIAESVKTVPMKCAKEACHLLWHCKCLIKRICECIMRNEESSDAGIFNDAW